MKNKIVIIGAGGQGRVCADIARLMGYDQILFLDDGDASCAVGKTEDYTRYLHSADFFVAIGNAAVRRKLQTMLEKAGADIATLIHPKAVLAENVVVGQGTAIMAGAVINPGTIVGKGAIVNTCASVDHDCRVGDYIHIAVGARICGTVRLEDDSWIGAGAVIIQGLSVCAGCMIGAGAVVVRSITDKGTYLGVPARKVK
ncbi:MAG: acetyltransferase [Oscillospiraceae bacterium]|nr:acetyltransferase [Oscillospiraceae bacterium]MBQ8769523.1 acetyltransferase [Oscillospiraceae bacterium]